MIVDVAALPGSVLGVERKVAIVIDALRASATIVAMLEAGASTILLASDAAEALTLAGDDRARYIICGESGGLPPAGFDYGNSPVQAAALDLAGRAVILSTSNGTRALHAVAVSPRALVGTGRNGPAVVAAALRETAWRRADLTIVCAGDERGTQFSLEDFFVAGYLVELLAAERPFVWPVDESNPRAGDPEHWVLDESALAARRLYRSYLIPGDDPLRPSPGAVRGMFAEARNGHSLPRIGYGADLDYCAAVACATVVPGLRRRDGRLVLVAEN